MATPYIGEIRMFGGNFAPLGWAFCSGQLIAISENDALFNLIGTTYGGDGQTTFALPDLQSRVPVHIGSNGTNSYVLGQSGGAEQVTVAQNQLPAHTHAVGASNTSSSDNPFGNVWANAPQTKPYAAAPNTVTMNAGSVSSTGGNQPHDNMIPFLAVNFIIALEGVYPTQN